MGMSAGTKRLLAVAVVVIVIGGVGVGAWFILTAPTAYTLPSGYVKPGAPADVPDDRIIRIGILDPMTDIQGDGAWRGAYLAAYEINKAGGVDVNGTTYYFGLIAEDTYEAAAQLDTTKGVTAADRILTVDQAQMIIGGFRTESLTAYIGRVMEKKVVFIGTGSATDIFCQNVLNNYTYYKYFFRNMPINSTSLAKEILTELAALKGVLSMMAFGNPTSVHKWAIIRENLDWTVGMAAFLKAYLPKYGYDNWTANPALAMDIAYPILATATDFAGYWTQIKDAGVQVVIPIISAQGGILMMQQYNATGPKSVIVGIDVQSQLESYWADSGGKCAYEVVMQSTVRTNKTSLTKPMWDNYVGNFSKTPLYTSVGSYDAMYLLAYAINKAGSLNSDLVVTALESITTSNPRVGAGGTLAFTRSHDILEGYFVAPGGTTKTVWGVTLWVQWFPDGTKRCITSYDKLYPESIVTGTIKLPPNGLYPG